MQRHIHNLFFFNDTATTEIYTLSLHDALPISTARSSWWTASRASRTPSSTCGRRRSTSWRAAARNGCSRPGDPRSEEHTSELQSQSNIVCRLLLEKKKATYSSLTTMNTTASTE